MKRATPGAVYSLAVSPGYRDPEAAVEHRRKQHAARVKELEKAVPIEEHRKLTGKLREELDELRGQLTPADESVEALVLAEDTAERYERRIAEALDLSASLGRHTRPWLSLPSGWIVAKWLVIAVVAAVVLFVIVHEILTALPG